ncbi:MerR family transcriptional regulator [Glutamicibacter creatinolyticus]|uniref:MerR family transcriptional regulator n=2 Tax=Glutamicibacter creatinolyticus TaxID=162496 RepID=A0A5B7WVL5_9MICC|nr:MerR family transcriptional regulator [Glutamicibacter creatinolyticus]QCY47969.1 MerR family transcriptional regulator [Glutamicibacter creatinolyticus]
MTGDYIRPVFVISVAAQLADMHPQTLRQYDRMGLVSPSRQAGKQRRYSQRDVQLLRQVQQLSKEGVSLEGIRRILQLEAEVDQLRRQVGALQEEVYELRSNQSRVFAAGTMAGDIVTLSRGTRPQRREPQVTLFTTRRAIGP